MYKRILFASLITGINIFTSCSTEETPVTPENEHYAEGIFILNEGNYGQGNSTVSFLDPGADEMTHEIFKNANPGAGLGDTGQSIGFYKDYAFVVMNVSNTIEVVDRNTFMSIATIDADLQSPRYIAFAEGKAFISNWGDGTNPDDDFMTVINAENFAVETKIPVTEGPEKVIAANGKIYVAHTGGYSVSNKVSVIDAVKNDLEEEITVGYVPNALLVEGENLWVLAGGRSAYTGEESAGMLSRIELGSHEVVQEILFSNTTDHPVHLGFAQGQLYYTLDGAVYVYDTASETLPSAPLFNMEQVDYLYGFEVEGSKIFAASANMDFTGNGKLILYDLSGNVLGTFETGINPNGIFSNE